MKLFFLHVVTKDASIHSKIDDQIKTFNEYTKDSQLETFKSVISKGKNIKGNEIFDINGKEIIFLRNMRKFGSLYNWQVAIKLFYNTIIKYVVKFNFTHILIRRTTWVDRNFIQFLKKLKKRGLIILYEIPTFPYDGELNMNRLTSKLEVKYREYLQKYVDIIVTPSEYNEIFGIKTIKVVNGIRVKEVKTKKIITNFHKTINLIAVAGLSEWHGYDRLISGLGIYYQNGGSRNIIFHLVGGSEDDKIQKKYLNLVKSYKIEKHVTFYGKKYNKELDQIYNYCDIGVEVLGMHRKNLKISSSLKSREYLAKGIPFISSCEIDILPKNYEYVLNVPADESPINMYDVIKFFDSIYKANSDFEKVNKTIREFALKTCDIKKTMQPIIKYINAGKN